MAPPMTVQAMVWVSTQPLSVVPSKIETRLGSPYGAPPTPLELPPLDEPLLEEAPLDGASSLEAPPSSEPASSPPAVPLLEPEALPLELLEPLLLELPLGGSLPELPPELL